MNLSTRKLVFLIALIVVGFAVMAAIPSKEAAQTLTDRSAQIEAAIDAATGY